MNYNNNKIEEGKPTDSFPCLTGPVRKLVDFEQANRADEQCDDIDNSWSAFVCFLQSIQSTDNKL